MTLQASGAISASQINTELGVSSTSTLSFADNKFRALADDFDSDISISSTYNKRWYTYFIGRWVTSNSGNETTTQSRGPAEDSDGNLYYVVSGNPSYSAEVTLIKCSPLNKPIWRRNISGSSMYGIAVDVNSSDEIFVVHNPAEISKFNKNGDLLWTRTISSITSTDASGQIASIRSVGTALYIRALIRNQYNYQWIGMYKLNSDGSVAWGKHIQPASEGLSQEGNFAVDSSGNVILAASTNMYDKRLAVVKFASADGATSWNYIFPGTGGSPELHGSSSAADSSGNIYIHGFDWSGSTILPYVMKLNSSGDLQWARQITWPPSGQVNLGGTYYDIDCDNDGNSYTLLAPTVLSGVIAPSVNSNQYYTYHLIKYNSSGTIQWQRYIKVQGGYDYASGTWGYVRLNRDKTKIYVNTIYLNSTGAEQRLTLRFPTDGTGTGTRTIGTRTVQYEASSLSESALTIGTRTTTNAPTIASLGTTTTAPSRSTTNTSVQTIENTIIS